MLLWMSPLWKTCLLNWQKLTKYVTLHFSSPKQTDTVAGSCKQAALLPPPGPVWHHKSHAPLLSHTPHSHINQPFICFLRSAPSASKSVCQSFFRQDTCLSKSDRLASAGKPDKPAEIYGFCSGIPHENCVNYRTLKMISESPNWLLKPISYIVM